MRRVSVEEAAELVERGGVVAYPTETVYGVGADAFNDDAVRRVYDVKSRPHDRPVSVAVADTESLEDVARLNEEARRFVEDLLPGPVTPLVPRRPELPDLVTAGSDVVGVRVPDDETALSLLGHTGPLTSTSANVSGEPAATSPDELGEFGDRLNGVVDDGPRESTGGVGSTVVDTAKWEIVREGTSEERVRDWLSRNVP
jgi:L-threonylcarbamoyladenylate synthase